MAVLADAVAWWRIHVQANGCGQQIAWIGRTVRPEPDAMPERCLTPFGPIDLAAHSITVTPHGRTARFWAIEHALRNTSIGCIVADGSKANHVVTRRLHVLAMHTQTLVLLARPTTEQHEPSSAQSRWCICRTPTKGMHPCWNVRLLRERFASNTNPGEQWTTAQRGPLPLREGFLHWTPGRTLSVREHA
jgi:hypothetical protein